MVPAGRRRICWGFCWYWAEQSSAWSIASLPQWGIFSLDVEYLSGVALAPMRRTFVTVVEVDPFEATAKHAGLAEEERGDITLFLARHPSAGDIIPGTGGLRKVRFGGKGKGKRGGYRTIHYYFNEAQPVYLLAVYPKNQQVDLTPQQKVRLTALSAALKAECRTRERRRQIA